MIDIPNIDTILTYVLNGLFALIVFLFLIRPIFKTFLKSIDKLSGENAKITQANITTKQIKVGDEQIKKQKVEEIKKKNAEIQEQAEKEVEAMEKEVISKLFDGKPIK